MDTNPGPGFRLLAIDPGAAHVGWVVMAGPRRQVVQAEELTPEQARARARDVFADAVAIEGVTNYGQAAGKDVFRTCYEIGRLLEIFHGRAIPVWLLYRPHVRLTVGGHPRAKEPDLKAAMRDWYGGERAAKGCKANPGPLYHVHGHAWSALALAFAWHADRTPRPRGGGFLAPPV
jgi:hypothetical protein